LDLKDVGRGVDLVGSEQAPAAAFSENGSGPSDSKSICEIAKVNTLRSVSGVMQNLEGGEMSFSAVITTVKVKLRAVIAQSV
jgi:hypothetical protein